MSVSAQNLPELEPPVPTIGQVFFSPPDMDLEQQEELERTFIASLQLPNGVNKTTFRHRLDDLNELVQRWLPAERPLHIMDTAVSTGVTTWEWTQCLRHHRVEFSMSAGDLNTHAYIFSVGEHTHAIVDKAGKCWQIEIRGKVFQYLPSKRHLLRHLSYLTMLKVGIFLFFGSMRRASRKWGDQPVRKGCFFCHPIPLVNARLRQAPNVRIIEDDLCVHNSSLDRQFHVVRAANILNRVYFDDAAITALLVNLRSRLRTGGLLVVCRTDESGKNNGTIYRLAPDGTFTSLARLGAGSEIENLVLAIDNQRVLACAA